MSDDRQVTATINYIAPMNAVPQIWFYEPEPGTARHDPVPDPHDMAVRDLRGRETSVSLDGQGFQVVDIDTPVAMSTPTDDVRANYYPAVEERVKQAVGATQVVAFDHNFRSYRIEKPTDAEAQPVIWPHIDYTEKSGPQRVRDVLPADAAARCLKGRYMFLNLWRPVTRPVEASPLGICAADSLDPADFVLMAMRYPGRTGQVYFLRHNPNHRWHYISRMRPDEALLFKGFDSETDGRARWCGHGTFEDPASPADAAPRESIETRAIAFFD